MSRTTHQLQGIQPLAMRIVACAALSCPALAAAQDTGTGVDMQFGTRIDPSGQALLGCDEHGMSWLRADPQRTPTGFLFQCPPQTPEQETVGDWLYSATLPLGFIAGGDDDNAQWQRYSGWDDGLSVGPFNVSMLRPDDGTYVELRGSRLTSENQYYKLTEGRAGHYRIEAFYRDQPNVVSGNARSLWNGVGSSHLTLADGLTPAGSTPAQVTATLATTPERRLEVQREKLGLGATYYFSSEWTVFLNGTFEERKGARPFGGPFFFNFPFSDNGGILEIPRVIDDGTTNFNGGARFVGQAWRMEFAYAGSFYRSRYASYDYENPFQLTPVVPGAVSPPLTLGVFASEPDNDYHNLRANVTRRIPLNGEASLTASMGQMKQNDPLLAPMNCQGQFGIDLSPTGSPVNPFLFDCDDWNTTAALSQTRADLKIDTSLVAARIVLLPARRITMRGDLRYERQDYRGDYLAFNPLTGQYGYVAENGAQGSVVPDEIGFWDATLSPSVKTRIRNLALDKDTLEASLGADWRLSNYDTLGATWTYARTDRDHREVATVDDNVLRLTWANRRLDRVTLRANYTWLRRSGDPYDYDPYEFTFSTSLPGYVPPAGGAAPHTVEELRKYDVSSRDQHKISLMATLAATDDMTLSASVRAESNDYDAELGREDYDTLGATLQWEWQVSPTSSASAYYGYDRSTLDLANVNEVGLTSDPALGGPTYPLGARWWVEDAQRNHYFGATLNQQLGRVRLELAGNYTESRGTTDLSFASPSALAWPDAAPYPAMTHRIISVSANLYVPLGDKLAIRLFDLYERGRLSDWHYLGLDAARAVDHRVFTDGGPEDYSENLVGVMFEVRL